MSTLRAHADPQALFQRQIDCIQRDDRETQLQLYAEDCVYEFPFAVDRPRRLSSREEIRRVMTPMWEEARRRGARVTGCDTLVHVTMDPEVIVAEFTLAVEARGSASRIDFVQVLRARQNRIAQVREYFSPGARSSILDSQP